MQLPRAGRAQLDEHAVEITHVAGGLTPRLGFRMLHDSGAGGHNALPVGREIGRYESEYRADGGGLCPIGTNVEAPDQARVVDEPLAQKGQECRSRLELCVSVA